MQALLLAMIVAVTTFPWLAGQGPYSGEPWLPRGLSYTPELLSLAVAAFVVVAGVQSRFKYVRPVYWLVFGGLLLGVICGAIVNQLQPGPMFAGIRTYLRAIPFFFLPAVLLITQKQLRTQLYLLVVICVIQLPIAARQRWRGEQFARESGQGWWTGDHTIGTLLVSGHLTLFLVSAACVLTGFYLRHHISSGRYLSLLFLILLPTALNETKVTLVLLPIAMLTTFIVGSSPGTRVKSTAIGIVLIGCFLAVFIPIYDYFIIPRWGYGLIDFFLMDGRAEGYLITGAEVGGTGRVGTLDSIFASFAELARDPVKLTFGLGIGNTQHSQLGHQFTGAYFEIFAPLHPRFIAVVLLEQGLLGVLLILTLHWLIFVECVSFPRAEQSMASALAIGWSGVSAVIAMQMIYSNTLGNPALEYLYWYFSGVVVASAMRFRLDGSPEWGGTRLQRSRER